MNSGVTATSAVVVKSVLDKPLHDLTEDDISQVTREDCRRYLKDKGMRRPSWNKSQAIQQVISLKSLLEPSPTSNAVALKSAIVRPHLNPSTTVNSNSSSSIKELSPADAEGSVSALGEDGGLNQPAGTSSSEPTREGGCRLNAIDSQTVPLRSTDASPLPFDQMTIFYSGGVNVYDGVPIDKQARAIMHLAASPIQIPHDERNSGNSTHWSSPYQLPTASVKLNLSSQDGAVRQSMLQDVEGQPDRQVSLQRYFEKKKDRGKFKMKRKMGSSPSSLEAYLNKQMRKPVIDGQSTQSNTTSLGLADKEQKNYGFFALSSSPSLKNFVHLRQSPSISFNLLRHLFQSPSPSSSPSISFVIFFNLLRLLHLLHHRRLYHRRRLRNLLCLFFHFLILLT